MKKTIALLLAMAGMAMGAQPLILTWDKGEATPAEGTKFEYEGLSNSVTIVAELNWSVLLGASQTNGTPIFTVNDGNGKNHGMDIYVDAKGKYFDQWINNKDIYGNGAITLAYAGYKAKDFSGVTNAIFFYTTYDMGGNYTAFETRICLSYDNGVSFTLEPTLEGIAPKGYADGGFDTIASFTYNETYVNKMDVYNTYLMGDEYSDAINRIMGVTLPEDNTIPEPTTATLSLLALAGLAARRRRK